MRSIVFRSFIIALALVGCDSPKDSDVVKDDTEPEDTDTDTDDGPGLDDDEDGFDEEAGDCDDDDPTAYPGAPEECDGVDDDCDGTPDNGATTTYYADTDGDGYGDANGLTAEACDPPPGYAESADDCDDGNASINPGAVEACDDLDNDCDGTADESVDMQTYYADTDGDGMGDPDSTTEACGPSDGWVENDDDCDDNNVYEPVHVAEGGWVSPDSGDTWWGDTSDSGGGSWPGSASNPYARIQEGIDIAQTCVHVHGGTYYENIDFGGRSIEVSGVDGSGSTTIQGTGSGSVVNFDNGETSNAVLRGFTITGGGGMEEVTSEEVRDASGNASTTTTYTYCGGGIYVNGASPTLTDLVVTQNSLPNYSYSEPSASEFVYVYSFGGGICMMNTAMNIDGVTLSQNYADNGGGAWSDSASVVNMRWVVFDDNWASAGGGLTSGGTTGLSNSVFVNNVSDGSGGGFGGAGLDVQFGTAALTNVTAHGNSGIASVYIGGAGSVTSWNSTVDDNTSGYVFDGESGASLNIGYSNVYGGSAGNYGMFADSTGTGGNVSTDPGYVSATDLHLASTSALIDAGDPAASFNDADGTANDIGAFGGPEGAW